MDSLLSHDDSIYDGDQFDSTTTTTLPSQQLDYYSTLLKSSLLLLLFLSPHPRLLWRLVAMAYSLLLLLSNYNSSVTVDSDLLWPLVYTVTNATWLAISLLGYCKGDCCHRNSNNSKSIKEVEQVYSTLFAPLHITRKQFSKITSCKKALRVMKTGEKYSEEKVTRVESLSLVLRGRLLVSQHQRPLHIITPYQFVDSPEFFGVATDEYFQVTITAMEETKLLVWHRDKLRLTIIEDEFLKIVFDHVLGRDVVRKLIQVSDSPLALPPQLLVSESDQIKGDSEPQQIVPLATAKMENEIAPLNQQAIIPIATGTGNEIWSTLSSIDEEFGCHGFNLI